MTLYYIYMGLYLGGTNWNIVSVNCSYDSIYGKSPFSSGLENCTRPLVFTSGSSVRASGNCHLLARQDE